MVPLSVVTHASLRSRYPRRRACHKHEDSWYANRSPGRRLPMDRLSRSFLALVESSSKTVPSKSGDLRLCFGLAFDSPDPRFARIDSFCSANLRQNAENLGAIACSEMPESEANALKSARTPASGHLQGTRIGRVILKPLQILTRVHLESEERRLLATITCHPTQPRPTPPRRSPASSRRCSLQGVRPWRSPESAT